MFKKLIYIVFHTAAIVPQVFPQSKDDQGGSLRQLSAGLTQNPPISNRTYCNPMNIDYGYTPIPNFTEWGKHRATADPVIVLYKNDYYLFSTNQWGYWWSSDMLNWNFVSKKFLRPWNEGYDELCAPAV